MVNNGAASIINKNYVRTYTDGTITGQMIRPLFYWKDTGRDESTGGSPTVAEYNPEIISLIVLGIQDYPKFIDPYIDSEVCLLRMDPLSLITRDLHNYFKPGIVQFKLPNDFVNLIYKRL